MRVRLLREAGGVGDVVCAMGCATAIKRARPDAHVSFYSLGCYAELVGLCPDVDRFVGVSFQTRRNRDAEPNPARYRYLRDGSYDATVDLYCPGWQHEWGTQGDVKKGRAQIFCETAAAETGLTLRPTPPRVALTDYDRGRADGWLAAKGTDLRKTIVGLQPQANLESRKWPTDRWHEYVDAMRAVAPGVQFVCFGTHGATRRLARELEAAPAIYLPYRLAAALLARCAAIVGVDSGFYHLAAATHTPAVGLFGVTGGASTSAVYSRAVWLEAGDDERERAGCACVRHCYNMPSAGKQERCDKGPCPAMAEIPVARVVAATVTRLAIKG